MSLVLWDGCAMYADSGFWRGSQMTCVNKLHQNDRYILGVVGRLGRLGTAIDRVLQDGLFPPDTVMAECEALLFDRETGRLVTYNEAPEGYEIDPEGPYAIGENHAIGAVLSLIHVGYSGISAMRVVSDMPNIDSCTGAIHCAYANPLQE